MDADLRKILKAVTLEMRHALEGRYDKAGKWQPGDLENRLAEIGVRRDRESVPVDELQRLPDEDIHARKVVDAYIDVREEAGDERSEAVAEFVRESAYTWVNRLLALRCMEARGLIDEVILQKESYGGRSLEHHRLVQREPELCTGDDDGRFQVLRRVFAAQAERLPMLFDPQAPGVSLRPSPAVLKRCMALLSGTQTVRSNDPASDEVFMAPDALGWAYQYWNTEEKERVFERVRTVKGAKIEGADIIPATQLYTESYMVQFLVQNSLGATWMGMHPESKLYEQWDYYVRDADRAPVECKPVRELTFLDPACGSGHFLLEAFDLLYAMYEEEGEVTEPHAICDSILTQNLFGIDIDARAVQIAEVVLWMKAAEKAFGYEGVPTNLVAAVSSHLKGQHWDEFLDGFEKEPSVARVLRKFGESLEHIDELGSLARPNVELKSIIAEEHIVWERQVREKKEANYLFPEMREDALSGKLPFNEISDEQFGHRLFNRARMALDSFTSDARKRGEFQDQFLGREGATGFKLLDVLGRQYTVINANPPYMGTKNMGKLLKRHIEVRFPEGKRDLYASFLIKSLELSSPSGRVAMVTQQSWMFLRSFAALRGVSDAGTKGSFGLLRQTRIEALGQLGRYAFSEIGNAAVAPVLVVLSNSEPIKHRLWAARLSAPRESFEQAAILREAINRPDHPIVSRREQQKFLEIPGGSICYWLRERFFELLLAHRLGDVADVRSGLSTGNNDRFLRWFWEVPNCRDWPVYCKGGGYSRWHGFDSQRIAVRRSLISIRDSGSGAIRNLDYQGRGGLTYTENASGCLGVREMDTGTFFDAKGPGIFTREVRKETLAAILNSRVISYVLRAITQTMDFDEAYMPSAPIPEKTEASINANAQKCIELKRLILSVNPTEPAFRLNDIPNMDTWLRSATELHSLEAEIERAVFEAFALDDDDIGEVISETGRPAGWYSTLAGYENSETRQTAIESAPQSVTGRLGRIEDSKAIEDVKAAFLQRLQAEDGSNHTYDQEEEAGARKDFPPETIVEELSLDLRIHPVSVFALLQESKTADYVVLSKLTRDRFRNLVTGCVLTLLGHRWPGQGEVPTSANAEGIIPLTKLPRILDRPELALYARVAEYLRTQFRSDFSEVEFEVALNAPLATWLKADFFSFHCGQFKKRPVAWLIQSAESTSRRQPAYASLLYYHKLDGDLIRKVRKQAEDLRKSLNTELRGITSKPVESRSEAQEQRHAILEDDVDELRRFDRDLEQLITNGFDPDTAFRNLRQHAFDNATMALKGRWLSRLSSFIGDTILNDWLTRADEIHMDLALHVGEAFAHLDHHCATVGIVAPTIEEVGPEPTARDLATLICVEAVDMFRSTLVCACRVWWKQFDEVILGTIKAQIKQINNERAEIKARLEADPEPEADEVLELRTRDNLLLDERRPLNAKLKRLKAGAEGLKEKIESWFHKEPLGWDEWLCEQPLFDNVTSLDGEREPPETIAEFVAQESRYAPDINDGVRVNIAPLQKAGLLAADVLAAKDVDKAIADRAEWRADERRWVRQGILPKCGWWPESGENK